MVTDAMDEGTLTLQIHNARTSDDGQYRCLLEKDGVYQEASLDLKVVGKDSREMFWIQHLLQLFKHASSWEIFLKPEIFLMSIHSSNLY